MKIFRTLLCLMLCHCTFLASAQGFKKTYAGFSSAVDVVETTDGGYLMVGNRDADTSIYVQHTDNQGVSLWSNSMQLNGARALALTNTPDGGFAVLAEYYADTNGLKNVVLKFNSTGTPEWMKVIGNYQMANGLHGIVAAADGSLLLAGDTRDNTLHFVNWLVKLGVNGDILWQKTYGTFFQNAAKIIALPTGNFALAGGRNNGDFSLDKVDADGNLIWEQNFARPGFQRASALVTTVDGGFALFGTTQNTNLGRLELFLLKTDAGGNELWSNAVYPYPWPATPVLFLQSGIVQDDAGNYYIPLADTDLELLKLNPGGAALWKKPLQATGNIWAIIRDSNNFLVAAGDHGAQAQLLKFDSEGEYFSNKIVGTVYREENADCTMDNGETGQPNAIVQATSTSGDSYFKRVNADGSYEFRVPPGQYKVFANPAYGPPGMYTICDTLDLTVSGPAETISGQFIGMEAVAECPLMEVEIGQGLLRRCTTSRYTINYCNYGNLPAQNLSIQVVSDTLLSYVNAEITPASQNGDTLTFNLPDLNPGECSHFYINYEVSCAADVNDVICLEAHAYPDTSCLPPDPLWDGSEIELTGACDGNDIRFRFHNVGSGGMANSLDYVIIEDHILYMNAAVQLGAGADTTVIIANPQGYCYLGQIQNDNHSTRIIRKRAVVENCITGGNLDLALDFDLSPNNAASAVSCDAVVGSFDPNDKRGFPLGYTDEHLIDKNQDIEYMIRFQNTGNDTAFLVVVRDTLPFATLDPGSLYPLNASHPYTWSLDDRGVATFTFANILLPDSTTNEPASHGFVRFRVHQQRDLPDNTRIENRAAIYFDFNAPVLTNTWFHTIGKPIAVAVQNNGISQKAALEVIPNPFTDEAVFSVRGYQPAGNLKLVLMNTLGGVVRELNFEGTTCRYRNEGLPPGIYFFSVQESGAWIASGKVIAE